MTTPVDHQRAPLAIVGVSALFPGSHDAEGFWRDIRAGRDLLSDVPASHWLIEDYYDPDPKTPDKTYARRGGFHEPVSFDPLAWGVPPAILRATDTTQLLALMVAEHHGNVHRAAELRDATVLSLLERTDALRRPERFEQFLLACEADSRGRKGLESRPYPQADFFRAALAAVKPVVPTPEDIQTLKGPQIAASLHQRRLAAIGALRASITPAS